MRMPACAVALGLCVLLLACAAPAGALWHRVGDLSLAFDSKSGDLAGLRAGSSRSLLIGGQPDAEIHCEPPSHNAAAGQLLTVEPRPGGITVRRQAGEWEVVVRYQGTGRLLRRQVAFTWRGAEAVKVTGSLLRLPGVTCGDPRAAGYLLPADYPVRRHRFAANHPGRRVGEEAGGIWASTGLVAVCAPSPRLGLVAGYRLIADGCDLQVEEGEGQISLVHHFWTLARVAPGETLECGEQVVRVSTGGWEDCLQALGQLAGDLDNGPPADRPAWAQAAAIYSCHPGGPIETGFRGVGGIPNLAFRLPALTALGFTALWLNPIHEPPPWVYTVRDYRAIAPTLGTHDDFRAFVATAHAQGLKVLMDLVPHGPAEDSPAAREAGAASWTYREDGTRALAWGSLAGDHASPAWQRYMAEIAGFWVGGYGVDGFRVDCAPGNEPNWRRGDGRRPSVSSPLGGEELLAAVRTRMHATNPEAALFPEAWQPIWFRHGDFVYDYPWYHVMRRLAGGMPVAEWVQQARAWLQMQRLTVPPAARGGLVRFVENHDTARALELFGVGPSQALTALCILAQGTPLIYQDQEIGSSEPLGRWLRLRRETEALHAGEADYEAVRCSRPEVMAFLRRAEGEAAIVAVSLLPYDARVTLRWPAEVARAFPHAREAWTGAPLPAGNLATISLPAWQPAVIMLSGLGHSERPGGAAPRTSESNGTRATASPALNRTPIAKGTEYRLEIGRASAWFVSGADGFLCDSFADRHTAQPSQRFDYLWRPLEMGLWDAPGPRSMGVIDGQGRLVAITEPDLARLDQARIEDPSGCGEQVVLVMRGMGEGEPFQVTIEPDGAAALARMQRRPVPKAAGITMGPLTVQVETEALRLSFLRRRGGLLGRVAVRREGRWHDLPLGEANFYTDWGLYDKGQAVSAALETSPRVETARQGDTLVVTFRGLLRGPSWNGVQRGWPASPPGHYRLTYRVTGDRLEIETGLTLPTDRPGARAFLAYVLPFTGAQGWLAETPRGLRAGNTNRRRQGRWVESKRLAASAVGIRLSEGQVVARLPDRAGCPQNVFVDGEQDHLALYLASLEGVPEDLKAGQEWVSRAALTLRCVSSRIPRAPRG